GVRIQMEEGAEIKAEDELSLHGTYISGCDFMWKGIKAETNIFLYDSFVEDAEFGVKLENSASIVCLNTEFINDYIGIAVGSPFEADQFDQVIYRCQIWGCKFYTSSVLANPYPDQYYDPSWPTSPSQIPYNLGFAAFFLSGVSGVNIGFKGATGGDRNKIYQMRNGIVMRNSDSNIYGTDFYDFEGSQVRRPAEPILDLNQFAVNSFRSHSFIDNNTIDNILVGVFAEESFNTIHNNEIELPVSAPTLAFTRGISILRPQLLLINDNQITNGSRGILLESVHSSFEISDNQLFRNLTTLVNIGIDIRTVKNGDDELGLIKDNEINIEDGNGSFGIYLNNVNHVSIEENDVNYNEDLGSDTQNRGISSVGSSNLSITGNSVLASEGYTDLNNHGIELFNSFYNGLTCNEVDNFVTNLQITGPNTQTGLFTNILKHGIYGLYFDAPVMIGIQIDHGNKWTESYTAGAFIGGFGDPVVSATNSKFIVDAAENSDFMPSPIGPLPVTNGVWFKNVSSLKPTLECEGVILNPFIDPDTLAHLIRTPLTFTQYNDEVTWMMKSDIFEMMLLEPGLHSNAVLDSFYDVEVTNGLGKLVTWQTELSSSHGVQTIDKREAEGLMYFLSNEIDFEDSILAILPHVGSFGTWLARRTIT
ncbi:MAG: right-handed parallel beta-helix repeat-containing protein, partial [Saprospiraceae bacterium]